MKTKTTKQATQSKLAVQVKDPKAKKNLKGGLTFSVERLDLKFKETTSR